MLSRSRREISSRWPIREGRPLKNHTCEHGEASSMWPMRSRRTLLTVTSTPHLSQITPRCFMRLYLPQRHSQSVTGPLLWALFFPLRFGLLVRLLMVSGFVTSPCDHDRIFSGEASMMRMASKSVIGLVSSNGFERNKATLLGGPGGNRRGIPGIPSSGPSFPGSGVYRFQEGHRKLLSSSGAPGLELRPGEHHLVVGYCCHLRRRSLLNQIGALDQFHIE